VGLQACTTLNLPLAFLIISIKIYIFMPKRNGCKSVALGSKWSPKWSVIYFAEISQNTSQVIIFDIEKHRL
jgi:hypothetical protein